MSSKKTFEIEDKCIPPFFVKQKISIEKGEGIYVWDEEGKMYIDFTSGWGVTCIGHANPVITDALLDQGRKLSKIPIQDLRILRHVLVYYLYWKKFCLPILREYSLQIVELKQTMLPSN
jgi:acetylornithine/succinyldiaminopimelate/putrescine aminotransferase